MGRMTAGDRVLIDDGPRMQFFRATTDNDRGYLGSAKAWKQARLDHLQDRLDGFDVMETSGSVTILVRRRVAPPVFGFGFRCEIVYRITSRGVQVNVTGVPEGPLPATIPRIGVRLRLPTSYEGARWLGFGPGESYVDSREAALFGIWDSDLDGLFTPYIMPQENGNRSDCRWIEINGQGQSLRILGMPTIDFSLHRHSAEQIEAAQHLHQLAPGESLTLNLDYRQHGLGTASCGPDVLRQYALRPHSFAFGFQLIPS